MVVALTIRSTGTRPADELTRIGGRKHARFVDGTVRRGPAGATGPISSRPLPTSAPPARPWSDTQQRRAGSLQLPDHRPIQRPGLVLDPGPGQHRAEGGVELPACHEPVVEDANCMR